MNGMRNLFKMNGKVQLHFNASFRETFCARKWCEKPYELKSQRKEGQNDQEEYRPYFENIQISYKIIFN